MHPVAHDDTAVALAVALVNELTAGWSGGQPRAAPSPEERPAALAAALRDRPHRGRTWVDAGSEDLDAAVGLASRLRDVFAAADADDVDRAATTANALLAHGDVRPVLSDHDGTRWHLHAHWPDASPADALRATCALALASQVAADGGRRLGVCAAAGCDRVFHDTSRNASRRYCSSSCQARTKTAAFRARRTT